MSDNRTLFEERLRRYQRLTLTLFYPPLLSLFACCSGYFYSSYGYFFSYAFERFLMLNYVEMNRGVYSFAYFIPLLVAVLLLGLFLIFTLYAAKGKFWALIAGSTLYLADAIYSFVLISPQVPFAMEWPVYLLQGLIHLAFIVLYGFAIANYAKLDRPSPKRS
ncbi:MAG: hypothetical protein WCS90_02380 [Bacilli bacterium]